MKVDHNIIQITPSADTTSSKIIQINGKYYAEVSNNHVEDFLAELALSLAAEVDTLRERLLLLEEQIRMYQG
jgi:hypothetical protein